MTDMDVLAYRVAGIEQDINRLGLKITDHSREVDDVRDTVAVHSEQITGKSGLYARMDDVVKEIGSLKTALYGFTASFMLVAFTLAGAILNHAL